MRQRFSTGDRKPYVAHHIRTSPRCHFTKLYGLHITTADYAFTSAHTWFSSYRTHYRLLFSAQAHSQRLSRMSFELCICNTLNTSIGPCFQHTFHCHISLSHQFVQQTQHTHTYIEDNMVSLVGQKSAITFQRGMGHIYDGHELGVILLL